MSRTKTIITVVAVGLAIYGLAWLIGEVGKPDSTERKIAEISNRHSQFVTDSIRKVMVEIDNATPEERLVIFEKSRSDDQPVDERSVRELLEIIEGNPEHRAVPGALGLVFVCLWDAGNYPVDLSAAFNAVLHHHLDSVLTAQPCYYSQNYRNSEMKEFMEAVNIGTSNRTVRGVSAYALAQQESGKAMKIAHLKNAIRDLGDFTPLDFESPESRRELEKMESKSVEAGLRPNSMHDPLKEVAERELHVLEHFTEGD